VPEPELIKEFLDIILFIQKQNKEFIIKKFIDKSRQEGLSEKEKIQLQELLKNRHQQISPEK
jgi:DNA primase